MSPLDQNATGAKMASIFAIVQQLFGMSRAGEQPAYVEVTLQDPRTEALNKGTWLKYPTSNALVAQIYRHIQALRAKLADVSAGTVGHEHLLTYQIIDVKGARLLIVVGGPVKEHRQKIADCVVACLRVATLED